MSGKNTCSFAFCYYHLSENVIKDGIKVDNFKCDHCSTAFYHSDFCKKLDKDHMKKCGGFYKKKSIIEQNSDNNAVFPLQVINIDEKENRRWSNSRLETSRDPRKSSDGSKKGVKKGHKNPDLVRMNNYEINMKKLLGEGSYGKVVLGKELLTGVEVGIKIVNKTFLKNNSQAVLLKREIYIQRKLQHQNILSLIDVFEDSLNIYLVLEFCQGGSLFDYIQKKKGLSEKETFVFFLQACLAIETLHKHRIVHRDIKPENLLLDKANNLKLCDFGCSFEFLKHTPKIRKTYCGTVDYMAPEFFRKVPHGMGADIWALGILLFEMAHSRPPFDSDDENDKIETILDCDHTVFDFKSGMSTDFKDLVERMLKFDTKQRPSFDDIFCHPWMLMQAQKLEIDIQKIRYRENLFGDYHKKEVGEFFAKCELRPTEVALFADDTYIEELEMNRDNNNEYEDSSFAHGSRSKGSSSVNDNILCTIDDNLDNQQSEEACESYEDKSEKEIEVKQNIIKEIKNEVVVRKSKRNSNSILSAREKQISVSISNKVLTRNKSIEFLEKSSKENVQIPILQVSFAKKKSETIENSLRNINKKSENVSKLVQGTQVHTLHDKEIIDYIPIPKNRSTSQQITLPKTPQIQERNRSKSPIVILYNNRLTS